MDTSVAVQRSRPQNLSLNFGGSVVDSKALTASFKPLTNTWNTDSRLITSATFKNGSIVDDMKPARGKLIKFLLFY